MDGLEAYRAYGERTARLRRGNPGRRRRTPDANGARGLRNNRALLELLMQRADDYCTRFVPTEN